MDGFVSVGTNNGQILKFNPAGGRVGGATGQNSEIHGLSFSPNGDLFASYLTLNRIHRFQAATHGPFVTTNQPVGIACAPDGLVYVTDTANGLIKRFTPTAVGSVFVNSGLSNPRGLAVDRAGNVYAANAGAQSIMKYSPSGSGGVFAAGFTGGPAYIAVAPDPTPVAVSRKVHGTTSFDVDLPLTGAPGIECRTGGTNGDHVVAVTFLAPVSSVGGVSVTTGAGTVSGVTISDAQVFVSLEGVANAQRIGVTFSNVTFGARTLSFTVPMGLLLGDTTGNGTVTASDVGQTKAASGQTLGTSNFRTDVTASGFINATDVGVVKASAGTVLPP